MTMVMSPDEVKICVYASVAWILVLAILLFGAYRDYLKTMKKRYNQNN